MEKTEIILLVAVLIFASIRIYQKYFRKESDKTDRSKPAARDSLSSAGDDDYEPYSGK
jgi:hypothetical protein